METYLMSLVYIYIYVYKQDLVMNNQQELIWYITQPTNIFLIIVILYIFTTMIIGNVREVE